MKTKEKQVKPKSAFSIGKYFAKYKFPVFMFILTNIIGSVFSIFITIEVAEMVGTVTNIEGGALSSAAISSAIQIIVFIICLTVAMRLCWYLSNVFFQKYSRKIMQEMSSDLAKQAFKLNSKTYADHNSGIFVQRIVSDPVKLVDALCDIVYVVLDVVSYLVILIYIAFLNIWLSLGILALIAFGIVLNQIRLKIYSKNSKIRNKAHDGVNALTTEIVKSEKDIKSLGLEAKLAEISSEKYLDYHNKAFKTDMTDCNFWSIRNAVLDIGMLGVLILGLVLLDKAMITMATFMIVFSWRNTVYDFVWSFGNISTKFVDIKISVSRMKELFDEEEYVTEKFGNVELENAKGKIEFKNVAYTFREYKFEREYECKDKNKKEKFKDKKVEKTLVSENQIFKNLSFKIEPNTTVAFVGKSGSGKSTILNIISKMCIIDSGKVLIDGVDINTLSKNSLRNTISLVNQFPYIFDMTIKENLLLAKPDATDDELWDALKKASLKEFVEELSFGLDTKVGESGIKLSGGQKQRLAIARAMLRNSPITIFDESTSALDNFAQTDIKKSIDKMKGKSTIIIVAHRLSTIKNVDKIFFLESGKIVDSGTFDELFETNDNFKAMFLAENI